MEWINDISHLIVAVLAGLLAIAGVAVPLTIYSIRSFGKIRNEIRQLHRAGRETDERVNLRWTADTRRGRVAAENKGLLLDSDPMKTPGDRDVSATVIVSPDARKAYFHIMPILRRIWDEIGRPEKEGPFAEELEKRMGPWLTEHVCKVLKVSDNECHAIAEALVREKYVDRDETPLVPL